MSASESSKVVVPGTPLDDKIQVGQKYGQWTIKEYAGKVRYTKEGRLVSITDVWSLECSCGAVKCNTRGNILKKTSPNSHCPACEGKRRLKLTKEAQKPAAFYKKWKSLPEGHLWEDFEQFSQWMESQDYHGKQIKKRDESLPHGPGNSAFEESKAPKYDQALAVIAAATNQPVSEVMEWGSTVSPARVYQRALELSQKSTDS
jgi:hypothetical protein